MKKIATHNGTFHADEVSAIALLKVFKPDDYVITRLPHQTTDFNGADYVIDTGRIHDNITRFDHHQWKGGLSSAGLLWEHIGQQAEYPSISKLIKAIDDNDVGVKPAEPYEYSRLIGMFNKEDNHSEAQYESFLKAIDFAVEIFQSLKDKQAGLVLAKQHCADAPTWPGADDVLDLGIWQPGWNVFVNGKTRPEIEAVVWYDAHLKTWNIQTTNVSVDSYEKVGKKLLPWDEMNFVHSNNFFAVAKDEATMTEYIRDYRG